MKGQIIFYSFLPGVTAAVLTTQPTWAQQVVNPSISTPVEGGDLVAENTSSVTNLPTTIKPVALGELKTINMQRFATQDVNKIATKTVALPIGKISFQDVPSVFSLAANPYQTQPIDSNQLASAIFDSNLQPEIMQVASFEDGTQHGWQSPTKTEVGLEKNSVQQTTSSSQVREKLREVRISRNSTLETLPIETTDAIATQQSPKSSVTPVPLKQNPDLQASAFLKNVARGSGSAKLLETENCSPDTTSCSPQNYPQQLVSQAVSPTPTAPTINNQQKRTIPPPDYLNPDKSNPLLFPTRPEEVRQKGTQPITLEQAVELAQRNNTQLQIALLELERAKAALREAQAALFPTVDLSAGITRQQSAQSQLSSEIRQQQEEGLPPELRSQSTDEPSTSFSGQAQLIYNIYTSGRRSANIGAAEEQLRFQELNVANQSEEIRLNVAQNYYNLQEADENVRIRQSAVRNAEVTLRDAQALERAGVGTKFDVLRAQVTLANAQQQLSQALSQQRIARSQLATTLNIPDALSVNAADPVRLAGLWNLPLEDTILLAYQNRPELQQQLAQRNLSEQRRRLALADLGPQISLVASYNLLDQFDDSISVTDGYSLGVQATLNLYDGGAARARADQQRANIRIAETQFNDTRNQIRFQVEQAYSELRANLDRVNTANIALEQARESLRLARLRFQAGVGTQTDVIAAEDDLTEAEGNVVSAILSYNRALASLQRSVTARGLSRIAQ
ncbi:TolC family protein [Fischerella thermalis]|uniref:TolC family protein n=2 Tax=Fischerella thermalis TaxID=372787 RepID=UPI000C80740C|nr:TolC family protein [Fischerella thermalis]PLZ05130.1 transporter [Fischerella thermalis WC114]PLZ10658.1 transporter [Fischerella thermalis WC119]PLZ15097.1 transporter [Fischerella thermalis WC1110]PLZ17135.1 transporter [Fischerella thermalis WC157]PLZ21643.1 transporter [Fischerella thermalis WC559]